MSNDEQTKVWNQTVAGAWVRHADWFDATLQPLGAAAMDRLAPIEGERALDIGCGTGSTTRELASRIAPAEAVGIDLSRPMIEEAIRRIAGPDGTRNVTFVVADVQSDWFTSASVAGEPFDVAYSRCGVMFFPDPVLAFSRIAASLRPNGRLGFICFKTPFENPFITVPILAATAHLDLPSMPGSDAPSPFSLADPDRIASILGSAGFESVEIADGPDEAVLTGADDLDELSLRVLEQNPTIAGPLAAAGQDVRDAAVRAAADALSEFRIGDDIRMGAGTWIVSARTPL